MAGHATVDIVQAAVSAALSRRARDPIILDLRELGSFTDYFAICSGTSDIQVEAISAAVLDELEEKWNVRPWHREGLHQSDWVLLDYVDFVVHIFLDEKRNHFNLERLWIEAPTIEVPDVEVEGDTGFDSFEKEESIL
ncbi:MAG: ribosome silencing factor [Candidatus Poribacteria bacterium]|nr:ribosome silencing factor [Candidatus Poribacteria bacterium]